MKCYICSSVATSKEHVPAKGFFPEQYRLNLIKVPSCNAHNSETSKDDEYIRNIIAMTKGVNNVAVEHFRNKGLASFQRSPALEARIAKNPQFINLIKDDDSTKNLTYEVERDRFDKVIKKIAYGLYFHKYKKTWERELAISTDRLISMSYETDPISPELKKHSFLKDTAILEGNNPKVFQYAFIDFPNQNEKFLLIKFYEAFEIWALPKQNSDFASL